MNTKKILTIVAAASLAASAPGAGAGEPRRAQQPYSITDDYQYVGGPDPILVAGTGNPESRYEFPIRKGERYVSVEIFDDREEVVAGVVSQWKVDERVGNDQAYSESAHAVTYVRFCGETENPVKLKPKLDVVVLIHKGTCADGSTSLPTNGDIAAQFFRK